MMRLLAICVIFSALVACSVARGVPPITIHATQFMEVKKDDFVEGCRMRVKYMYVRFSCEY